MVEQTIKCDDPEKADVVLLGVDYDRTSSFGKGADRGARAIIECLNNQIEIYERFTRSEPLKEVKVAQKYLGNLNNLAPEEIVEKVAKEFGRYYSAGKFVILLGGEHSVSNGAFMAIANDNVTVLQIDAHADLRDTDADYNAKPWGKYAHSCVMRRACELGLGTVQVGVRAYSRDEHDFWVYKGLNIFEWGRGKEPAIKDIINAIKTDKVYITIDVDGIDPSHMPATGTPVQGGLTWYYLIELLQKLFKEKEVVGADIVEVAPRAGDVLTEYGAAQICYNLIAWKMAGKE